jgi:hypothetical protein
MPVDLADGELVAEILLRDAADAPGPAYPCGSRDRLSGPTSVSDVARVVRHSLPPLGSTLASTQRLSPGGARRHTYLAHHGVDGGDPRGWWSSDTPAPPRGLVRIESVRLVDGSGEARLWHAS